MFEYMIKAADLLEKSQALSEIRERLATCVVERDLPKRIDGIRKAFARMENAPPGVKFTAALVEFVLWINGNGGSEYTPPPQAATFKDPAVLIKLLPYTKYRFVLSGDVAMFYPAQVQEKGLPVTLAFAEALLRQLPEKQVRILYIAYEGRPCQLMWVDEDGLASIKVGEGYRVQLLRELVK